MTIIALALSATRGLIASDTLLYLSDGAVLRQADGTAMHGNKVHELAHAHCVFVCRGSSALSNYLDMSSSEVQGIEHAIEHFPQLLREGWRALGLEEFYKDKLYKGRPHRHECQLIGWSKQAGKMLGATFERDSDFAARVRHIPLDGSVYSFDPYRAKHFEPIPHDDADTMAEFVRLQLQRVRDEEPDIPYGGRLVLVEVDQAGMRRRDMGDLGLPAARPLRVSAEAEAVVFLGANAATRVLEAMTAGSTSITCDGSSSRDTLQTLSVTTGGGTLELTASLDLTWTTISTTLIPSLGLYRDGTGVAGGSATFRSGASNTFTIVMVHTETLAAGTYEYTIEVLRGVVGETASAANRRIRSTEIRR
jgi:hypothetical protein